MSMNGLEKYKKLVRELATARMGGELLDETEAYFAQALDDCFGMMSKADRGVAADYYVEVLGDALGSAMLQRATDAVLASEKALQAAIKAFEELRDAEVDLANACVGEERDIGNRGFARADVALCVLRGLGNE